MPSARYFGPLTPKGCARWNTWRSRRARSLPRPACPAPRCQFSLRPPARARPPWKTGKRPFPRARACPRTAEKARGRVRRAAAPRGSRSSHSPAARQLPSPWARSREERTFARAAALPLTKGNRRPIGDQENGAEAGWSHGLTARDGSTTRKGSPPTRKQPRAPQKEKAQRAPAAITLASTPPAPIYSPLRTPRDLPSLAPARSPTSDVTQPQAGRARLAG